MVVLSIAFIVAACIAFMVIVAVKPSLEVWTDEA
jgi:hypothetical protein